jgi:4a-hydroxytetrahydrobiopterin dehydratase
MDKKIKWRINHLFLSKIKIRTSAVKYNQMNGNNQIMSWKVENKKLVKSFKVEDFSDIINRLNELSPIANKMDHHPDFEVFGYNNICFKLSTHTIDDVSELDYQLAELIDLIFEA